MALKSAAFDLVRLGEPVLLDPGLGLRFSAATGEYQAPDRVRARVKVAAAGTVLEIDTFWLPEGRGDLRGAALGGPRPGGVRGIGLLEAQRLQNAGLALTSRIASEMATVAAAVCLLALLCSLGLPSGWGPASGPHPSKTGGG